MFLLGKVSILGSLLNLRSFVFIKKYNLASTDWYIPNEFIRIVQKIIKAWLIQKKIRRRATLSWPS